MNKRIGKKTNTVSVVLILHNDPPQLEIVLDCLKKQSYDKAKTHIICLDDGTSPKGQNYLKKSGAKVYQLPYNSNISYAKNYALRVSTDDFIFYLDDRLSLDINAIKEAVKMFDDNPHIAGVCGYYPDTVKLLCVKTDKRGRFGLG